MDKHRPLSAKELISIWVEMGVPIETMKAMAQIIKSYEDGTYNPPLCPLCDRNMHMSFVGNDPGGWSCVHCDPDLEVFDNKFFNYHPKENRQ